MYRYAIGDVHGEYDTLQRLVDKLPKNSELYFVGDLIDRGPDSKKVVDFVRKGNHKCVLGNHEDMMVKEARGMKRAGKSYRIDRLWNINGGLPTLLSYGIVELDDDSNVVYTRNKENIDRFIDDAEWMEALPLFIELETPAEGREWVVISHAAVGCAWPDAKYYLKKYREHILWNRGENEPCSTIPTLNIHGHTPTPTVDTSTLSVNIDTGCVYKNKKGFGILTALNLETLETVSDKNLI